MVRGGVVAKKLKVPPETPNLVYHRHRLKVQSYLASGLPLNLNFLVHTYWREHFDPTFIISVLITQVGTWCRLPCKSPCDNFQPKWCDWYSSHALEPIRNWYQGMIMVMHHPMLKAVVLELGPWASSFQHLLGTGRKYKFSGLYLTRVKCDNDWLGIDTF